LKTISSLFICGGSIIASSNSKPGDKRSGNSPIAVFFLKLSEFRFSQRPLNHERCA